MGLGGAALAAGVAGVAGSVISSGAASDAASTQANATNKATDLTQANYAQTRNDLAPYRDAGTATLNTLQGQLPALTAPYGGTAPAAFNFNPTQADLAATPGYQFTLDQGLKSVQNAASAKGLGVSGAAMKAAADYGTGLADSTWKDVFNAGLSKYNANLSGYNTAFNVDQANKTNAYNKLMGLVGAGQSSAAQTGAFGQQATAQSGNLLTSGANAQAAGIVGSANAVSNGLTNTGNTGMNYALMNRLMTSGGGSGGGISDTLGKYY